MNVLKLLGASIVVLFVSVIAINAIDIIKGEPNTDPLKGFSEVKPSEAEMAEHKLEFLGEDLRDAYNRGSKSGERAPRFACTGGSGVYVCTARISIPTSPDGTVSYNVTVSQDGYGCIKAVSMNSGGVMDGFAAYGHEKLTAYCKS